MAAETEWLNKKRSGGGLAGGLMGGLALGLVGMMVVNGAALGGGLAAEGAGAGTVSASAVTWAAERPHAGADQAGDLRFGPQALGTVGRQTVLWSQPGGGRSLGTVAAGTGLEIGGKVRVPAGLGTREVLWVNVAGGMVDSNSAGSVAGATVGGPQYGFLAAEDVVLAAGEAPLLDLRGVPAKALLAPSPAVRSWEGPGVEAAEGASTQARIEPPATGGEPPAGAMVEGTSAVAGTGVGAVALSWLPDTVARWRGEFEAAGARYGVDPELLAIVTLVESGGNPRAVSSAGAVGLMQIMPATGAGIAREKNLAGHTTARLYEPAYNIDFGAYYLAQQLGRFGRADGPGWQESVELAASAYNGGPGSVQRYLGGGALPAETVRYRRWVGGLWRERREASPTTLAAWLAAGGQVLVDRARAAW